jgi:hypothetical protein
MTRPPEIIKSRFSSSLKRSNGLSFTAIKSAGAFGCNVSLSWGVGLLLVHVFHVVHLMHVVHIMHVTVRMA